MDLFGDDMFAVFTEGTGGGGGGGGTGKRGLDSRELDALQAHEEADEVKKAKSEEPSFVISNNDGEDDGDENDPVEGVCVCDVGFFFSLFFSLSSFLCLTLQSSARSYYGDIRVGSCIQ